MWTKVPRVLLVFVFICVCSQRLLAQNAVGFTEQDPTFQRFADSVITTLSTKYKIPGGAVAITDNGRVAFQSTFGWAQMENKIPVKSDSKFRLGSVTKMFTAIAVMQLAEQGKVNLDAPVETYITDLKINQLLPKNPIKIRHLLTHTSGLTDDILNHNYGGEVPPQQTLVRWVNEEVPTIEPGYIFNYSNIGYGLLGVVIERVSGLPYADYMQRHIFTPLGLLSTSAVYDVSGDEKAVTGYSAEGNRIDESLTRDIAAGGIISTIEDLVKLMQTLSSPDLLEQAGVLRKTTFETMYTPQTKDLVLASDDKFGLGLFIIPLGVKDDEKIGDGIGHGGDFSCHHAITMVFPKSRLGISIVCNGEEGNAFYQSLYHRLLRKYYAISRDTEGAKSAANKTFSPLALRNESIPHREISGNYGGGGGDFVRLKRINDQKIRFKQGKHVLILKRNNTTNRYHVRYKLLRLIPVKVKDMEFGFIKTGNRIVLKACYPKSGDFEYISRKDISNRLSKAWADRAGTYEIVNPHPGNNNVIPQRLTVVQNKLVMHRQYLLLNETDEIAFDIIDDKTAVSDGIDRGCGATLKVLPNGNLYYSGYEMKLVAPHKNAN